MASKSKKLLEANQVAQKLGVDPLEILLNVAKGDWKALGYSSKMVKIETEHGIRKVNRISLQQRIMASREALAYVHPKLKFIDHEVDSTIKSLAQLIEERALEKERDGKRKVPR